MVVVVLKREGEGGGGRRVKQKKVGKATALGKGRTDPHQSCLSQKLPVCQLHHTAHRRHPPQTYPPPNTPTHPCRYSW